MSLTPEEKKRVERVVASAAETFDLFQQEIRLAYLAGYDEGIKTRIANPLDPPVKTPDDSL